MTDDAFYFSDFYTYEYAIKCPSHCTSPDAIGHYVHLGLVRAQSKKSSIDTKKAHLRVINTLEHCVCDTLLNIFWRERCFKYILRLMPLLFELLSVAEYKKQSAKIKLFEAYFLKKDDKACNSNAILK